MAYTTTGAGCSFDGSMVTMIAAGIRRVGIARELRLAFVWMYTWVLICAAARGASEPESQGQRCPDTTAAAVIVRTAPLRNQRRLMSAVGTP